MHFMSDSVTACLTPFHTRMACIVHIASDSEPTCPTLFHTRRTTFVHLASDSEPTRTRWLRALSEVSAPYALVAPPLTERYVISAAPPLGSGLFSVVVRAAHARDGTPVAIKASVYARVSHLCNAMPQIIRMPLLPIIKVHQCALARASMC